MTPADEAEASENEDIEKEATHGTAGTDELFNALAATERGDGSSSSPSTTTLNKLLS